MAKEKIPMTSALRVLKDSGEDFEAHRYKYEDKGGTENAARQLGVDEHGVIKTLVFQDQDGAPLLVLMHGDRQVSAKTLARNLDVKSIRPCDPDTAHKHTGYLTGGISPFGTRKRLPVFVERTVLDLPEIIINGGKRGLLVEISPDVLTRVLGARPVDVGL